MYICIGWITMSLHTLVASQRDYPYINFYSEQFKLHTIMHTLTLYIADFNTAT